MGNQQEGKSAKRECPYCEGEVLDAGNPFCKPCGVTLKHCAKCEVIVKREAEVCPQCGGGLEWK